MREIRQVLPKPYQVTVATWSIGAYGEGPWTNAQPQGEKTGMALNLLRSPEGKMIDQLHILSYDAVKCSSKIQLSRHDFLISGLWTMAESVF